MAFNSYTQSLREFNLPVPEGIVDKHREVMKAAFVTYFSGYVSYQVDTVKNKGTLRSNCMKKLEECCKWLAEADLDSVLKAKVTLIKKMS